MIRDNFDGKHKLVSLLSNVFEQCLDMEIANIELRKYRHKEKGYEQEFIVLTWKNGAISTANNNMNSLSATARNITRMLDGGVYENLELYKEIMKSGEWDEILGEEE